MKSSKIGLIFKILGFGLVTFGIILTIIFMIDFNAYNFNLIRVMIFALGFPFVGIVIIIISVALSNYKVQESELKNISDKTICNCRVFCLHTDTLITAAVRCIFRNKGLMFI